MRAGAVVAVGVVAVVGVGVAGLAGAGSSGDRSALQGQDMAVALVDGWIEAVGGMESYWTLRSATFTLTTEMYDAESGRLRRTRPRYVTVSRSEAGEASRIERWEGDDFIQQGFNGQDSLWATMNGEPLGPGDKDFDETIYVARDVVYWISLPYKLKDPGVFLHYDGQDEDGLHQVRVTFGEDVGEHDDTWFYSFEEGRAVPVRIAYREEGKDNINLTRWEDLRQVEGYFFAGKRVHFDEQGRITKVLTTSEFDLNPGVEPSVFTEP